MKTKKYIAPKFPRLIVTAARHKALGLEAIKNNTSVKVLVEKKFKEMSKK